MPIYTVSGSVAKEQTVTCYEGDETWVYSSTLTLSGSSLMVDDTVNIIGPNVGNVIQVSIGTCTKS